MKSIKIFSLLLVLILCLCCAISCNKSDNAAGEIGNPNTSAPIVNNELNRKIVYTVRLGIEADEVSPLVNSISQKCSDLGGYIESRNEQFDEGECTSATVTYRVPTEKLDEFVAAIEGNGGVESKSISSTDITTTYVDAQAKKNALVERKVLLEEMLESTSMNTSERINIINEISAVNTELQAVELLITDYDSDVNYSTVVVSVDQVATFWQAFSGLLIFVGIQLIIAAAIVIPIVAAKKRKAKRAMAKEITE
jgi:hypothetical protein